MPLEGKAVLISGGARGMGAAEAKLLARERAKVANGDTLEDTGRKTEAEIIEAVGECTVTAKGVVSRRYPMNLQTGLGHQRYKEDLDSWASGFKFSEDNQRAFYKRWSEVMDVADWNEL